MSYQVKQSTTAYPLVFFMADALDHVIGKTGLSPTVTLSKAGGSFASPAGAVSEIANGWYKVAGNATDSATLGPLILHATATGADVTDGSYEVVAFDPQSATTLGLSGIGTAQTGDAYAALTGAQAEPGQGAPAVNASPLSKLAYLFKGWRNKKTQTSSAFNLFADDASTVDQKAAVTDDGTTTTVGEVASGP